MKYESIKLKDFQRWYDEFIKDPHEIWLNLERDNEKICVAKGIYQYTHSRRHFNPQEEEKNPDNSYAVNMYHTGGTIVGFPGSITLVAFTNKKVCKPTWKEDLVEFLKSKGLEAYINRNDVMVDGYKVAGMMDRFVKHDLQYYAIHISINADADVVASICDKPMKKIPKGLSDYGITREEALQALHVE